MPVVVPFLIAIGTAVGASAAAAAVVGGLMVAGTAMTVVGMATGNKRLTQWGSILSLAGGVGALASGAMSATAATVATSAADTTTTIGTQVAAGTATTAATTGGEVSGMDLAADAGANGANSIQGAGLINGAASAAPDAAAAVTGPAVATPVADASAATPSALTASATTPDATALADSSVAIPDAAAPLPTPPAAATDPTIGSGTMGTSTATPTPTPGANVTTPGATGYEGPGSEGAGASTDQIINGTKTGPLSSLPTPAESQAQSFGAQTSKFLNDNKEVLKAGSGLIQGAANNASQQKQLQERYDLEQQLIDNRRANLSASVSGIKAPTYQAPTKVQ